MAEPVAHYCGTCDLVIPAGKVRLDRPGLGPYHQATELASFEPGLLARRPGGKAEGMPLSREVVQVDHPVLAVRGRLVKGSAYARARS